MSKILGIFVAGLLVCSSQAFAQAPPDWASQIKPGRLLFVTTTTGEHVEGDVSQVSSEAVVLKTPAGMKSVPYRDVRKVEKRDGVSNGFWTGVGIGFAGGAGLLFLCREGACGTERGAGVRRVGGVLGPALFGGLIGWGIDGAIKGRQTVFDAERFDATLSVSPARGGFAAHVAITW
jgi:hypothetical protein